ncbi:MAG: hypothetical protein IKW74_08015, partial [Thermoguttaceae bacterium]|nr:hypothetical protein [Thermoguttaceae bacterium]
MIRRLHKSPWKMVLAVTGGGSGVIGDLLSVPGGSQTLLEAIVPYSTESLCQFLRTVPEQYCSEKTARLMAMSAFLRAIQLNSVNPPADTSGLGGSTGPTDPSGSTDLTCPPNLAGFCEERDFLMGVGITASLVSDRPKRGEHRIYLAIQTLRQTLTCSLILKKGERSRIEEEHVVQNMLFSLLELRLTGEFEEETDSVSCHCVKLAGHQQGWFSCQKELWSCKDETSVDHPVWQEGGGKEGQNEETREIPLLEWASGSGILSQLVFGADKKTRPVIQGVRWLNHSLEVVKNRKNRPVILLPGSFN